MSDRPLSNFEQLLATRETAKAFIETFGPAKAAKYLAEGLSFDEAVSRFCQDVAEENAQLRRRIELNDQSERFPLSQGGSDLELPTKRQGMASKLRGKSL